MIKLISSTIMTEKLNNFFEYITNNNREIYELALPSLHRTVTSTFIFASAIKSMQWSFANYNTLLPNISLLLPFTKFATDTIANKFKIEEKKTLNNVFYALDKVCAISSNSILAYALFSSNNYFITTLGIGSLLFYSIEHSLDHLNNPEKNLETIIAAGALEIYFIKMVLPIFYLAKQFFSKSSPSFNPLTQCPSSLPNPFMSPMGFIPEKVLEESYPTVLDKLKTFLFSKSDHIPEIISPITSSLTQEISTPVASSASRSTALVLANAKGSYLEKIKSIINTASATAKETIALPTDIPATDCTLLVAPKNTSLENGISSTFNIQSSVNPVLNTVTEKIPSTTSSYFTLPILAGIAATALVGLGTFILYRKYKQENVAPSFKQPEKIVTPEIQKPIIQSTASSNEQLHRFQKVNADYNLSEIQAASASIYNKNRYFITRYSLSTARFAKALIFNATRCIGYIALSTFFALSVVTQKGRSYLKTNIARIFTNLTGTFISFMGMASPYIGSAAYVTQMKLLYPILSENKEKLSTAQIHQFIGTV